jgi:hypothetical protein
MPDERAFRVHLEEGPFRAGVEDGRWWLIAIDWPIAFIAVRAVHRPGGPDAFVLRFDLTNYPSAAPTSAPWDLTTGALMGAERRPKGERIGAAFNAGWNGGSALYIPCDRIALQGHDAWPGQYRAWIWDDRKDITFYLRLVSELLNEDDYTGA